MVENMFIYQAPAKAGADPKKKLRLRASDRGYICNNSGAVFRQSFSKASGLLKATKLRIRQYLGHTRKSCRRAHVEICLRKKVILCRNPRFRPVMRVLPN